MHVEYIEAEDRLIVRPRGELDAESGDLIPAAVEQRLALRPRSVTIDLDQLDFVSLGGIRAMLRVGRYLRACQSDLEFSRGSDAVRDALHHAGLNNLFVFIPPYHSRQGASR